MTAFDLEPPDEESRRLWSSVGDLIGFVTGEWVLIGGGLTAVGVPGGSQALVRQETVAVRLGDRIFSVRRPSLLGARLIKARSLMVHRDPDAQREDLLLLLSLVDDPRAMADDLKRSERLWLRNAAERLEFDRPSTVGLERARRARLALRLLLRQD